MRIFLTGATGFIGSHVIPELLARGHQVTGLTRSDAGAAALAAMGADAHRGTLEEPGTLAGGAAAADAVIHCAFDHDFTRFLVNCQKDAAVIEAMGDALAGTGKPLIITSGVGMGSDGSGAPAIEDRFNREDPNPRRLTELTGEAVAAKGVSVAVMRLPQVHDTHKQGLVTPLIAMARAQGRSAYLGDGGNRWAAAHIGDVAKLYALALDAHRPGARWHAVAEEGVSAKEIAQAVGDGLGVPTVSLSPDEVPAHFGPYAMFAGLDIVASSALTRERLGWHPTGPGLIEDLRAMDYAA